MKHQLRLYQLDPDRIDEFITVWREQIVPARREAGFRVQGAWVSRREAGFAWVISYRGKGTFAEAEKRYYESDARAAVDPPPTDFLQGVETVMVEPLV
jgi:hypothetical protein